MTKMFHSYEDNHFKLTTLFTQIISFRIICSSHSLLASNVTTSFTPIQIPAPRRKLIDLPENYLSLLSKADNYKCPNSVTKESKSPALCLVCGTIVCSQVCS